MRHLSSSNHNSLSSDLAITDGRPRRGVAISARLRSALVAVVCLLPTIAAALYFGLYASPRYVSEAQFVVRTGSKPNIAGGLASILQMTGISRAQDDTFAVQQFITSRSAIAQMPSDVDLRRMYNPPGADLLARYPNFLFGASNEELHRYLQWMINIKYDPNTAITTLKVQAFTPEDARLLAQTLLGQAEDVVNRINTRIRQDAINLSSEEVRRSEQRVVDAQMAITEFRNREMMLDPARNSILVIELVGKLSTDLAQLRATTAEMRSNSPDNPQIAALERRTQALEAQILTERSRIATQSDGLADKVAVYERLLLNKEFASAMQGNALAALESARTDARRQQLYLQRIVEPSLPDRAMEPQRFYTVLSILAGNLLLILIGWLLMTGVSSHGFGGT